MISTSDIGSIVRLEDGHRNRQIDLSAVDAVLESHEPLSTSALIPILQDPQERFGYLPEAVLDHVERALDHAREYRHFRVSQTAHDPPGRA